MEKLPVELIPNVKRTKSTSLPDTGSIGMNDSDNSDLLTPDAALTPNTEMESLFPFRVVRRELVSCGQSRFWFLRAMLENKAAFNIVSSIELKGHINVNRLAHAVRTVASKHSTLRTRFIITNDGEAVQEVLAIPAFYPEHQSIY